MNEEERLIMGMKLEHPLCAITLSCEGANVVIEQSLELTWGGDITKCRELMEWMFPDGKLNMTILTAAAKNERRESNNRHFIKASENGKTIEIDVRGPKEQAAHLVGAVVKSGGVKYLDRAIKIRGEVG